MVGHGDDDMSSRMIGQVLTTWEWNEARELAIATLIPDELSSRPNMTHDLRPKRNLAIGKRLELSRIALGKANAQGEFASDAGVKKSTYTMWETGGNFPGINNMLKLIQRYPALTLDWIYLGRSEALQSKLADAINALLRMEEEQAGQAEQAPPAEAPVPLPKTAKVVKPTRPVAHRQRA